MELTRDDFVREIGWVLYNNRKTLPDYDRDWET